ncbi:hypothetical protein LshimejAT787_0303700 [Lyophyllum shimeji]|uniref:Uncharacterized protein n=1 Tax=Lyophyllum shimeji TaxID=47721 RepID=A0A9P3PHB2_LYOSH|nr:hypothetical protein LshimejAT787_0303700 [Lyophyllum shimeji]
MPGSSTLNRPTTSFSDFDEQVLTSVDRRAIGAWFKEDNEEIDRVNDPENDGTMFARSKPIPLARAPPTRTTRHLLTERRSSQSFLGSCSQLSTSAADDSHLVTVTESKGENIGITSYCKALDIAKEILHTEEEKNVVARFIPVHTG